jgi:shikimate dehydrogenase
MTSPALQDIVALLGWPAAGNPAQYLFERAVEAAGVDCRFLSVEVAPERLAEALAGAAAMGFRGCLLAGPLRAAAPPLVAATSPAAAFAGAASLLDRQTDGFTAHMTEGRGAVQALRGHVDPAGARVLVLGAAAEGRAVALELALAGAAAVLVGDRDATRAAALVEALGSLGAAPATAHECGTTVDIPADVDIVVVSMPDGLPEPAAFTGMRADLVVAEMPLVVQPSPLAAVVAAHGGCLVDGLEIHAARTAIDFQALTGVATDPDMLRDALDEFLS